MVEPPDDVQGCHAWINALREVLQAKDREVLSLKLTIQEMAKF